MLPSYAKAIGLALPLALITALTGCGQVSHLNATAVSAGDFHSAAVAASLKSLTVKNEKKAFDAYDRNKDGVVTYDEVAFLFPATFKQLDKNGDGKVTFEESRTPAEQLDAVVQTAQNDLAELSRAGVLKADNGAALTPEALMSLTEQDVANTPTPRAAVPRNPVLILPGCTSPAFPWIPMERALKKEGYTNIHVMMAWPWLGDIREYARMAKTDFELLQAKSPTGKVDIMAHSMGGLIGRSMIRQFHNQDKIDHFITFGTPHHGSILGHLAGWGATAIKEMTPGSEFLTDLAQDPEHPEGVKCTSIRAALDELVVPHASSHWEGALNETIDSSAHLFLIDHPQALKWGIEAIEK